MTAQPRQQAARGGACAPQARASGSACAAPRGSAGGGGSSAARQAGARAPPPHAASLRSARSRKQPRSRASERSGTLMALSAAALYKR